jgi:hypothetical protein
MTCISIQTLKGPHGPFFFCSHSFSPPLRFFRFKWIPVQIFLKWMRSILYSKVEIHFSFWEIVPLKRQVPQEQISTDLSLQQEPNPVPYLEAYRKLSGSVTHDINNLLSSILGYSELLRMEISDANLRSSVDEIRTAGKRIASLTQLLSAFTDKYIYRPELLDLNEEISALKKYCTDILGKTIEMSTGADPGIWPVRADRAKIKQALIILALEIKNLLPRGGTLHISTQNLPNARLPLNLSPHAPLNYVAVTALSSGSIAVERVPHSLIAPRASSDNASEVDAGAFPTLPYLVGLANGYCFLNGCSAQELSLSIYLPAVDPDV